MEHEFQTNPHDESHSKPPELTTTGDSPMSSPEAPTELTASSSVHNPFAFVRWVFVGDQGLRGGWSAIIFLVVASLIVSAVSFIIAPLHLRDRSAGMTARAVLVGDGMEVIGLLGAAFIMALIERRRVLDFNLTGPRPVTNFLSGIVAGFFALSVLIGELWAGGWLHFGGVSLSGAAIARYAILWGAAFLLVGCVEEGSFRCYLQFTFTRSLNFWWALGILVLACVFLVFHSKGTAAWGVYAMVLVGLVPCLLLQIRRTPNSGFWQAAWVTSTLFGFIHVSNNGENWIGIFAAAAIGFVFCVSVWVTGSAWWAIGCHAGWDWGETYFYGTADSGMVAPGHFLSTTPFGSPFWSGGTDGPEGSILVLGAILLLLVALLVFYGTRSRLATEMRDSSSPS